MSLSLGTLTGFLELDASQFDGGLNEAEGKLGGFAKKGAVLAGAAGIAVGGALVAGVVGSMNVEAANDKLAAQLGLNAAESGRIGGLAGAMYADAYGDSLGDVNDAMAAVMTSIEGMGSASDAELTTATENAMNFASAMSVDVAGAAQSAGLLVRTGLAKDAAAAFDLMTAAAQAAGPAMVQPVLDAANEYGTNFAALGFSGEQAMGILVEASKGGEIALDKAGDAVKEFAIRATDLGDTGAQEALEALGLSGTDMANALLAGGDTAAGAMDTIVTGLQGVTDPAKQAELAVALFGTPLEDIGKDKIPAFLGSLTAVDGGLQDVEGSAAELSTTLNNNASTSLTSLKRQAEVAMIGLANNLLPAVNSVTGALATGFGPAVTAVTAFLGEHQGVVKVVGGALAAAVLVLGTVTAAVKVWTIAQGILNAVLAMNPIVLVVAAIAALVVGLALAWQHSETFRNIVTKAFQGVLDAVSSLMGGFEGLLRALSNVPGFGWANTAADAISGARGAVDRLNASLDAIPPRKSVQVNVSYNANHGNISPRAADAAISGRRAAGGPVNPYNTYLVGENGPEYLQLGSLGGRVIPNSAVRSMSDGGVGGRTVQFMPGATVYVNDQVDMDLLLGRAEFAVAAGGL